MPTPITPGRRTALSLGLPLIAATIGWNCFNIVNLSAHTSTTSEEVYDVPGQRLAVEANDGKVTLGPSTDGRVHVTTISRFSLRAPAVSHSLDAGGLRLTSDCAGWWRQNCSLSYAILVPPAFSLDVRAGNGKIIVSGLTGDARLSSSDGGIELSELSGVLDLTSSDGGIRGTGLLSATVSARSSDGSVDLTFGTAPTAVTVRSSDGGIRVRVPSADGYRISGTSSDGGRTVDPQLQNDRSERTITVNSSDGGVAVLATTVAG